MKIVSKILKEVRGANAIQYALLGALVAIAIITAVTVVGNNTSRTLSSVGSAVSRL